MSSNSLKKEEILEDVFLDLELVDYVYKHATKENMKKWFGMNTSKFLMLHIAGETEMKRYIKEKVNMMPKGKISSLFSF